MTTIREALAWVDELKRRYPEGYRQNRHLLRLAFSAGAEAGASECCIQHYLELDIRYFDCCNDFLPLAEVTPCKTCGATLSERALAAVEEAFRKAEMNREVEPD